MFTKENPTQEISHRRHLGLYYWYVPINRKPWDQPRWVDVTTELRHLSDAKIDQLVATTANLFFAEQVSLNDNSFDRFLKQSLRRARRRERALAVYGRKRRIGPGPVFDAALLSMLMVLGTLHFVS